MSASGIHFLLVLTKAQHRPQGTSHTDDNFSLLCIRRLLSLFYTVPLNNANYLLLQGRKLTSRFQIFQSTAQEHFTGQVDLRTVHFLKQL